MTMTINLLCKHIHNKWSWKTNKYEMQFIMSQWTLKYWSNGDELIILIKSTFLTLINLFSNFTIISFLLLRVCCFQKLLLVWNISYFIKETDTFGYIVVLYEHYIHLTHITLRPIIQLLGTRQPAYQSFLVTYCFYFITSSEFNAYQMWVKLVFFYSEKISYFFTSDWYDLYFTVE